MKKLMKYFFLIAWAAIMMPFIGTLPFWGIGLCVSAIVAAMLLPTRKKPWYLHSAGGVSVTLASGGLGGTLQTADGVCGMVLTGVTEVSGYTLGDTILVTSLANLITQGVTLANNPFAYKQVKEFYDEAGTGAKLYLMLVASTVTIADIADNTDEDGARKLLNFAGGKIKNLGIMTDDFTIDDDGGDITITNGLNADVYTAAANMKVMAAAYFAAHRPFRCIIGGSSYSGSAAALVDETAGTSNNRVAILIGDTIAYDDTYTSAALGLCLGRIAASPVHYKISRVKTGALTNLAAFLGATDIESSGEDSTTIAEKGFITFRTYPNLSGYFFSGDPMLTATTDDYSMYARGRVIDKAHIIAYATYIQEVDDVVPTVDGGFIEPGYAKWLEQQVINAINNTMLASKEIAAVSCFIDPLQNVLSSSELDVVLRIRPLGYATWINISLGYTS